MTTTDEIKVPLSRFSTSRNDRTLLMAVDDTGENAVPVRASGFGGGGGGSTDVSTLGKEATQQQALTALQGILAGTDGLEALLSALGVKNDDQLTKLEAVRALLAGTRAVSVAALPLPAGAATETKLEAVRALLAGTLTVNTGNADPATGARQTTGNTSLANILTALQGTLSMQRVSQIATSSALTIAAGASFSDSVSLAGRSPVRLTVGAAWTAADITVQTSPDGVTWYDVYDEYGSVYTIKAGASRAVFIAPGPLLAVNYLRLRSGTPAAPVTQAGAATLTLTSVPL